MNLGKAALEGIERYLALVPGQTRKRGRGYFLQGRVESLECVESGSAYSAVVLGGEPYEVSLEFANRIWSTDCSCPMEYDCKHAVAALLALQAQATSNGLDAKPLPGEPRIPAKPRVPQPPDSPVLRKLVASLGRELNSTEANYIRQLQQLHQLAGQRQLMETDLQSLTLSPRFFGWRPLELWLTRPEDDYHTWLFLAWYLTQQKSSYPQFMREITDLSLIESALEEVNREKEIAKWTSWFQHFEPPPTAVRAAPDLKALELRLVLFPDEARLQWRLQPGDEFVDFKAAHAKRFGAAYEQGTLNLSPAALPVWSAVFKPWHYESWWSYSFDHAPSLPALNRLLRLPLHPDVIVNPQGQPLPRFTEPLRLELSPPEQPDGDYQLKLVTAAGQPAPAVLSVLEGHPVLYLTEAGLYPGPIARALEGESSKRIPARALETASGLRFLHDSGLPMPAHLSERIRMVPVEVTISGTLKPVYSGSPREDLVLEISARAPGILAQRFTTAGWVDVNPRSGASLKTPRDVIPVHDRAAQAHFPELLAPLEVKWSNYPEGWRLRLTKKTPALFVNWLQSIPPGIEILLDPELASLRDAPVSGSVSLDVQESGMDWFDLKVVLNVGDTTLTPEELKLLLNARGGFVRLGKKGWRRLQFNLSPEDDEQLARLGLNARDFSAEPQRFHALQLADAAAKRFLTADRVEKIQRRVSELKTRVAPPLPAAIQAELRPYQIEGYHFLAYLTANRFGGVLADDMGLGKTLQALAWIAWLRAETTGPGPGARPAESGPLPALVVCPKSVTDNWRAEAARFYPQLRVRVWRGEAAEALPEARSEADLIVLNYAQLRSLSPAIAEVKWQVAILDEAQYIKNPDSQTAQSARALKAEHRLALTGTPIENRLLDLWSIFAFAMPGALEHRAQFTRRFNVPDDPLARRRLAARVRPFLLRRTKSQVAKDLPDRVEEDLLCEMEGPQQALYRAELKRARQMVLGLETNQQFNAARFNILTSLLRLRQICCHPALVDGKLRDAESAKLNALLDLLEPLMEEGHKVLVFSQFVTMLELLRETVKLRDWRHFYLAGDTENRGELVQEFQAAKGAAVFLISLKAGGFGLNLTAASYVVLFDLWWNPAVESQAIDRTHRIGQKSKVMAYRLLMRDSIEQKIRALQKQKASLADDVLGEERFSQSLTLEDLRFLFAD